MKIKPEQIERLVERLLGQYQAKGLITCKADQGRIKQRIANIIVQNFRAEEALEEEARGVMAAHSGEARGMDEHRMFLLVKQRLAQKKGFVL